MASNPQRPQIPADMKAFNEKLIADFRANKGTLGGRLAGSRLILLTTTGAKSGVQRTVVIGYRSFGDAYIAIASNNGNDAEPSWFRNLLADPIATVEIGPDKFKVRARVAAPHERGAMAERIDYFERQQALTAREIPIVVLERL